MCSDVFVGSVSVANQYGSTINLRGGWDFEARLPASPVHQFPGLVRGPCSLGAVITEYGVGPWDWR